MNVFHSAKIVLMAALAPLACSVAAGTPDDDVAGLAQTDHQWNAGHH